MHSTRHPDRFVDRHIGPQTKAIEEMLAVLGLSNLDELIDKTVPASIRLQRALELPAGRSESSVSTFSRSIGATRPVWMRKGVMRWS